ncbi:MAG: hypothetical protein EOL89_00065 [Actinobacteria bacterium]|nr:hypothetical protein [Actinomycetota bacterium]
MSENDTTLMTTPAEDGAPTVVVRRPRSSGKFVPRSTPTPDSDEVIIGRNLLTSRNRDGKEQTPRERRIAGDLPAWEPLPPGELFVRRGRH